MVEKSEYVRMWRRMALAVTIPHSQAIGADMNMREREILKLVVSGYIKHDQPISSLYLVEHHSLGLSSATIRSIFSELEEKGYLFSPHRSAGRIPTAKAFRYYVQQMPNERRIPGDITRTIQTEYLRRDFEIDQILDVTCRVLSMLTNYASVVVGPQPEASVLKHIELIDMGQDEVLVIIVNRSGTVFSKTLFLEDRIPRDYLQRISRYLNDAFKGCDLREVRSRLERELETNGEFFQYYPMIAKTIAANFDSVQGEEKLYTAGLDNLLSRVAGDSAVRIKELGGLFESPDYLRSLFRPAVQFDDVLVLIEEDSDARMSGLSLISASYKMGEQKIGAIGVIGPMKMDYGQVVSIVDYISRLISKMITRMSN